jgi:hypothetical protein
VIEATLIRQLLTAARSASSLRRLPLALRKGETLLIGLSSSVKKM